MNKGISSEMKSEIKKKKKFMIKNAQISYYVMGNKEKETILMVHPAFADHQIFEQQVAYFRDQYQVITIDMPGHGDSQVRGSTITLKEMPEILSQILKENDINSCHIVGVSLGSLVAQAFADQYPDQVKSVVVVGGYSIHKENESIIKAQRKEGFKWMFYILFSMKKFRRYATSVACHTDQGRVLFNRGIQHFNRRSFPAMSGIKSFFTKIDDAVSYPLLIINGEYDIKLSLEAAKELHELEKHSHLLILLGAGHCVNLDAPDEFNRALDDFFSNVHLSRV